MTASLRKDFDQFLFASVGNDADGNSVTLLTVLARLGVDPWEEAADLANLSREPAMQRLASRLEGVPNLPVSPAETVSIATRLIALLHRAPVRKAASPEAPLAQRRAGTPSKGVNVATYWLIGLIVVLVAQWAISSQHASTPMDTTTTPDSRN